ncbi:sn-glycerol-3-phosphate ABC transporter ATP-binding protein UgpC [Treponema sp.]
MRDFNLQAEAGELVVLVGPSGCGKSTTLRMIAGLDEPDSGEILIDGRVVNDAHPKDRDIAMVFQDYALYPHMNVKENLSFGLENTKLDKREIENRIQEASLFLDLSPLMGRLPKHLSGGQRQRVALGRALVRRPKAMLLDEPLSNLDAKLRVATRKNIDAIHKKLKAVMVYVTHDQVEAMTLGDRIVVMDKGEIQQIADPRTLYAQPANVFVAGFIGTPPMNLLPGIVVDASHVEVLGKQFNLGKESKNLAASVGKKIILGIRPEHLRVIAHEEATEKAPNGILATIDLVEFLGEQSLIHFSAAGANLCCRTFGDELCQAGSKYLFHFAAEKLHLFDSGTGQRLEVFHE